MPYPSHLFHLAIPCRDLDEAQRFYVDVLGCRLARRYADRITLDFYGDQVVCHLAPDKIDRSPQASPRHFGITFRDRSDFDATSVRLRAAGAVFFGDVVSRFPGQAEEHRAFFVQDPSNNLVEFKWYENAAMMY
jgi:extradiol dioxygenase family protein